MLSGPDGGKTHQNRHSETDPTGFAVVFIMNKGGVAEAGERDLGEGRIKFRTKRNT